MFAAEGCVVLLAARDWIQAQRISCACRKIEFEAMLIEFGRVCEPLEDQH